MTRHRVPQAGAIAVRRGDPPRFLLVTSRRDPGAWVFPKGHLEPGEDAAAGALRELEEEAGVHGVVLAGVGSLQFRSGTEDVDVRYFLVEARDEGTAREGRGLLWLPLVDALRRLTHPDARNLLASAAKTLPA